MAKVRSILFPVDFSERCAAITRHVDAAARRFNAAVTILHVVETQFMPFGPVETIAFPGLQPGALQARAEDKLESFGAAAFEGLRVRRVVETGDPALCIARLARDWDIGLIMMPTRGRGPFRATLLGSVAAKVLHDAECPVWTAAHVETLVQGRHTEWRSIVCAIDLSREAAALLRVALNLKQTTGEQTTGEKATSATIRIAHAVPGEEARPHPQLNAGLETFLKDRAAEAIREIQSTVGTSFEVRIEAGEVSRVVADCAKRFDADLVLAGRGLKTGTSALRSQTFAIVRGAGCPVLSV